MKRIVLASLILLLIVLAPPNLVAQEVEPEHHCDASLEVEVLGECLKDNPEGEGEIGFGILRVRNTGDEGISTASIQCWITPDTGTGTVTPQEFIWDLPPVGGDGPWIGAVFEVVPQTTRPDGSVEVRCEVTEESCDPGHNVGKGSNADFKYCPTAIKLVEGSFTAQSGREPEKWSGPTGKQIASVGLLYGGVVLAGYIAYRRGRKTHE